MDSLGSIRKRVNPDLNGGLSSVKRTKEMESTQSALGSKSKPCTKFFSTDGCPFGEGCHFQHYVPGGINAVARVTNLIKPAVPPPSAVHASIPEAPPVKTRMCNKYNTAEGCRFGDKCHFAHAEWELGKPAAAVAPPQYEPQYDYRQAASFTGMRYGGRPDPVQVPPPGIGGVVTSFGASATAKISVDSSLAGSIIGKGGVNTKHICRMTGAKLSIRDHDTDPGLKNIELEGTFDQIKQASAMVGELILNISSSTAIQASRKPVGAAPAAAASAAGPGSNFKTKMCEKFATGSCTFGDRCHFAHGESELRKPVA